MGEKGVWDVGLKEKQQKKSGRPRSPRIRSYIYAHNTKEWQGWIYSTVPEAPLVRNAEGRKHFFVNGLAQAEFHAYPFPTIKCLHVKSDWVESRINPSVHNAINMHETLNIASGSHYRQRQSLTMFLCRITLPGGIGLHTHTLKIVHVTHTSPHCTYTHCMIMNTL